LTPTTFTTSQILPPAQPPGGTSRGRALFSAPLVLRNPIPPTRPRPYERGREIPIRPNRPQCAAIDRIRLWVPDTPVPLPNDPLVASDHQRGPEIAAQSLADGTREAYGSGIYNLEAYSYRRGEQCTLPASHALLYGWVLSLTGSVSWNTISQYLTAVRAWHQIHGVEWLGLDPILDRAVRGAKAFDPPTAKRAPRPPVTVDQLEAITRHLNLTNPVHAAVLCAATAAFFGIARLGEIVQKGKRSSAKLPKREHLRENQPLGAFVGTILHLPWTKVGKELGEDIHWAAHPDLQCCPVKAMARHLRLSDPGAGQHLFGYRTAKTFRPLTQTIFTRVLNAASRKAGVSTPNGHSFRIGGTTEYLLRGVPFETVKEMGRWHSDAFRKYLRKHAEIIAPYLQPSLAAVNRLFERIQLSEEERSTPLNPAEGSP
jgi:integrase